jgi:hypothetical protein
LSRINKYQHEIDKIYSRPHTIQQHKEYEAAKERAIKKKKKLRESFIKFLKDEEGRKNAIKAKKEKEFHSENLEVLKENKHAIYKLITSYGFVREALEFALAIGDNEYVIQHYIIRERWDLAHQILRKYVLLAMYINL